MNGCNIWLGLWPLYILVPLLLWVWLFPSYRKIGGKRFYYKGAGRHLCPDCNKLVSLDLAGRRVGYGSPEFCCRCGSAAYLRCD